MSVEPVSPLSVPPNCVAVIVAVPGLTPKATPVNWLTMLFLLLELHCSVPVKECVVPSVHSSIAEKGCEVPTASVGVSGVICSDAGPGGPTVSCVVLLTPHTLASIVVGVVPWLTLDASPPVGPVG